jgi:hypothetical protein
VTAVDCWIALALAVGTVVLTVSLPNNLGEADESLILYEALRVMRGEVLYRDVFEIITPGCLWVFAALFRLFGATLTVARAGMAGVHALIVVLVFATCRGLGVRRALAAAAALAHLALAEPVWPYASPHWMGTLLQVVLVWLAAARPLRGRVATALALGVAVGGLIMVQQQKGAVMALGVAVALAVDALLDEAREPTGVRRGLLARELACAGAALAVVLPAMGITIARAGIDPVLTALLYYPLRNYPAVVSAPWGYVSVLNLHLAAYTYPALLRVLPLALVAPALRVALAWRRREPIARRLAPLVILAAAAIGSISYFPDFIHIAFIAPLFLIALAASAEWLLELLPAFERTAAALAAIVLIAAAVQIASNWQYAWTSFPVPHQTAFGRIDLRDAAAARRIDETRALVDASASRELLAYPGLAFVYLVTGADNPTPYQILSPAYSGTATMQSVIDTLERRQVPLVVIVEPFVEKDDPLFAYVRQRYERIGDSGAWRRR